MNPPVEILHEDNHLLVVVKPAGLLSQADRSQEPDLLTLLKGFLAQRDAKPGNVFLGLVQRLDRQVGGVLVLAKTSKAAGRLAEQLRSRQVGKHYLAVVYGSLEGAGQLRHWLRKDEQHNRSSVVAAGSAGAKEAVLAWRALGQARDCSLLAIALGTGRSHQIRVQLAAAGHPLLGDGRYGRPDGLGAIALWSHRLLLTHPTRREPLTLRAAPPGGEPWSWFGAEALEG